MSVGVADKDGNLTFYHQEDEWAEEWGFNSIRGSESNSKEEIPTIRFATWILNEIYEHKLPERVYRNYTFHGPRVIMKMDIKGGEYSTIPNLVATGAFCSVVNYAFGEFHPFHHPSEESLPYDCISKLLANAKNCMTILTQANDESYLHDGIPLPGENSSNTIKE